MRKGEIIEIIISELDLYIIDKVRELRNLREISQTALSQYMELADGFISKVENPKERAKYSIRHLNLLPKILKVSWEELLPAKPLKNDLVRATYKKKSRADVKRGEQLYELIKKVPLSEDEIKKYNKGLLD
ncbi:MAG TPA: hypothetical protein VHD35_02265 [Chitinophagaceae bacterium]|nr:hypothetical protein [Chitinophagaceae bacterium]